MLKETIYTANWKLDGNRKTARDWVNGFTSNEGRELIRPENRIIVAPPVELLSTVADQIAAYGLPIAIAAQNLNIEWMGIKHTGEANTAALIADCAEYVILGHPETRDDKLLTVDDVNRQLDVARSHNLKPIVCVTSIEQAQAVSQHDPHFPGIIAYEPIANIGTGQAAKPSIANSVCSVIKGMYPFATMLYGGSVDYSNIKELLS